ncbi:rho GDP-dissociation inhibitor [Streptomyces bambusae]|uniref:Uncharacterized protein n=1 Tax=Streptomyces bambusae TaxID=1550616 RepID=A0ABS6Z164_9ACTN|nr:rho GDP-dissociation inhibitor [Streptomyces bambusae]MBW5481469.1 hypothetical protein [Streptomyces bambusae]
MTDARFELLGVHLDSESFDRLSVPLDDPAHVPFALPEGASFTVSLEFRLTSPVDGLVYVDSRTIDECTLPAETTPLGSFRAGGPYEVVLPPEKLPSGRHARGTYTVTGTFLDGDGRTLTQETHRFRVAHQDRHVSRSFTRDAAGTPTGATAGDGP